MCWGTERCPQVQAASLLEPKTLLLRLLSAFVVDFFTESGAHTSSVDGQGRMLPTWALVAPLPSFLCIVTPLSLPPKKVSTLLGLPMMSVSCLQQTYLLAIQTVSSLCNKIDRGP